MKDMKILDERNFLTLKELRDVFDGNISVATINLLIKQGKIPSTRMGRKNLIPVSFARAQLGKGVVC